MIRDSLTFTKNLIFRNPIKMSYLIAFIILLVVNLNYKDITYEEKYKVLSKIEVLDKEYFIILDSKYSKNFTTIENSSDVNLIDNGDYIMIEYTSGLYITLWCIIACLLILIIVPSLGKDNMHNWAIRRNIDSVRLSNVKIDECNGMLYYHYKGKLLTKFTPSDDKQILRSIEIHIILDDYIRNPNTYLDYKGSEKDIRNNKIDDVLNSK